MSWVIAFIIITGINGGNSLGLDSAKNNKEKTINTSDIGGQALILLFWIEFFGILEEFHCHLILPKKIVFVKANSRGISISKADDLA